MHCGTIALRTAFLPVLRDSRRKTACNLQAVSSPSTLLGAAHRTNKRSWRRHDQFIVGRELSIGVGIGIARYMFVLRARMWFDLSDIFLLAESVAFTTSVKNVMKIFNNNKSKEFKS